MPEYKPQRDDYKEAVRAYHANTPAHAFLGLEVETIAPGWVTATMARRKEFTQQNGYLHAGILIGLADAVCGMAAWSLLPADRNILSVQISSSLQRAVEGARVVAEGEVIKAGRQVMVCEGTLYDPSERTRRPLVKATVTLLVVPREA